MNSIQADFYKMPKEQTLSIISKALDDNLAKLSIPLVCKLWYLISNKH